MPATLTYNPLTPQTYAECLRTNTCRYARYAEPTAFSAPIGGSAALCFHYSSFFIHHSSLSFTFSAKEKDVETGLSYFGSRYYSSDLSIWLSVDPMTAKYPSLSPYTYCANNPVRCVDPNGEDYTNFEDENGKLPEHIEDGSNAVFKLNRSPIVKNAKTGKFEKNNNAYFAFSRYDQSQNGIDEVNVQSVIDYAQTYTRKTFTADGKQTYCNYAAKFIALSFNSAVTELGGVDMNVGFLTNSASGIYKHIPSALLLKNHEEAVNMAKSLNSYGLAQFGLCFYIGAYLNLYQ